MTSTCGARSAKDRSPPRRLTPGMSTVTTRSTSRLTVSGATSRWPPGRVCNESGRTDGSAKLTSTTLPIRSSTCARARPAPMVSASGNTWLTTSTVRAADSTATAPAVSTRLPVSVLGSIVVTGVLSVGFPVTVLRPSDTVRVGVSRGNRALANPRQIGVGRLGTGQQFLHVGGGVGNLVQDERQRRREPHTGAGADPGPQRTLGPLQRGG